jgi:hypothetical protein
MDFNVSPGDALKKVFDEHEFSFTVVMKHGSMTIRFENFTDDFAPWVIYGPDGGEKDT